jgi:hypothetical protein
MLWSMVRIARALTALSLAASLWRCATDTGAGTAGSGGAQSGGAAGAAGATPDASTGGTSGTGGSLVLDGSGNDVGLDPDSACAIATEQATVEFLPVDIIWMVDNSVSMQPAVDELTTGLNAFAQLIASKNLDYKVIMLSLRSKTNPVTIAGSARYAVCIPPPLAGDSNCSNGPRFFQSSIDVRSTQPLEQFLGTLGQTDGYQAGQPRGGDPWKDELRANATRTIVVVSDDNSRLVPQDFEHFAGGKNPFNSLTLPAGILDPVWNGLFDGYVFDALYGWGSDTDPTVKCQYPGGTTPPSSGPTYTELVQKTGGVRAQICAGASAWGPFFDSVAQAVQQGAKLSCELGLPTPSKGTLDPGKVNVEFSTQNGTTTLVKVASAAACDASGGWYYDDEQAPTKVLLCPTSCDAAEQAGKTAGGVQVQILFGCTTIVK